MRTVWSPQTQRFPILFAQLKATERVLLSEHLACDGRALFAKIGELGREGIVSKRIDAPYTVLVLAEGETLLDQHLPGSRLCPGRATDRGAAGGRGQPVLASDRTGGVPPPRRAR